jgi:hypothetical protein
VADPLTVAHFQSILEFPFRRPRGTEKLAIGAVLTLMSFIVPVVPALFVSGYQKAVARRAILSGELDLPEWTNWGQLLVDGLKVFGVALVYLLPALAAFVLGYGGMIGASFGAALVEEGGPSQIVPAMPLLMIASVGSIGLFGLGLVLALAAGALLPPALMHMIARDEFAAAFRFREWGAVLRVNLTGFVVGGLLVLGLSFGFSFLVQILQLTVVLCCLVPVVLGGFSMYAGTVGSGLFALIYRDGAARLAGANGEQPASPTSAEQPGPAAGNEPLAAG